MASKFSLIVNEQHKDGFKFTFSAEDKEALKVFEEVAKLLIAKIKSIEVKVNDSDYE